MKVIPLDRIVALYEEKNPDGHWFDDDTLKFFASRLPATGEQIGDWIYFVSSEKRGFNEARSGRAFTVRRISTVTGDIEDVGGFLAYATRDEAKAAIRDIRNNHREAA